LCGENGVFKHQILGYPILDVFHIQLIGIDLSPNDDLVLGWVTTTIEPNEWDAMNIVTLKNDTKNTKLTTIF
jgi:hypothetical protein